MHRLQNLGRIARAADGLSPSGTSGDGYRGRFAPSPTGPLHLGSLLAALASYLDAKSHHGMWLLRIEDVDPYRSHSQAAASIPKDLERFGLHWDESIVRQSSRMERYRQVLERLDQRGLVYACTCSRKHLVEQGYAGERYPNQCREKRRSRHQPHALRVITPDYVINVFDRLQGAYGVSLAREGGDFILYRRDQVYAYHLAVVVDDYDQRITHVVRGVDLLDSTPRHQYLQQTLRYPTPQYLHLPVILAPNGQKLSKQTGAASIAALDPTATLFYLLSLLGHVPPEALRGAPVDELLAWAVGVWDEKRLPQERGIQAFRNAE